MLLTPPSPGPPQTKRGGKNTSQRHLPPRPPPELRMPGAYVSLEQEAQAEELAVHILQVGTAARGVHSPYHA